jgi:S-DNA-T family DNA segregation ATPase FtsK/SpoIIIE
MARNKKNTKAKNSSSRKKKQSFLKDERFKITLGIFLLFFSAYLLVAFISHFFTWKADQSFEFERVFSSANVQVENWAGKAGAYFSLLFITELFGIASFSVPFLLSLVGFRLLNIRLLPLRKSFRIALVSMIIISLWLSFLFEDSGGYLGSGLGGKHGYYVANWMEALLGAPGTAFLLFIATFAFLLFSFRPLLYLVKTKLLRKPSYSTKEPSVVTKKQEEQKEFSQNPNDFVFETEFANDDQEADDHFIVTKLKNEDEPTQDETDQNPQQETEEELQLTVEQNNHPEDEPANWVSNKPLEDYDPRMELSSYKLPPLDLLENHSTDSTSVSDEELISNKNKIVETLAHYKIQIDKIKATIGPTITLYEIVPAPGIRISKIKNLEDDIALSLAALGIRIIAPMPGKGTIGIEVPNQKPDIVSMLSILSSRKFQETKFELPVALGKTISNETYIFELTKMPHLLIAGATGQGKSVGLNAVLTSILYKKHPSQVKFVLVDPKKVELTLYSKIERHFLAKLPDAEEAIVTDTQKVIYTLNSLTIEMDRRYDLLKKAQVRNIKEYNDKFIKRRLNPEKGHRYLPYIVVVVDEFADLIMTAGREIENPLARLAQLARAVGIHLIIATQRPTTNIITGVIKANFPARIAFRVTSGVDSKTILDTTGANQLIGRGDMLISSGSDLVRLQCAFIDIPELERITDYVGSQQGYPSAMLLPEYEGEEGGSDLGEVDLQKKDDLFDDAARLIVQNQQGSTSLIQRKFSIGYNRAGRIIDQLEAAGIVGPFEGSKARQVLIPDEYALEQYLNQLNE